MAVDIILLLILVVFTLSGYRKGLILSLCGLLILVVSCLGASVAQELLTPKLVTELHPQVTAALVSELEEQVTTSTEAAIEDAGEAGITIGGQEVTVGDLISLLERFGLDVEQSAQNAVSELSDPIVESAASAMAGMFLDAVVGFVVFLGAFLLIYLVLRTVELSINTVDRLPVIHTLNHLGGGLVGIISGAFLLVVAMTVLSQTGLIPDTAFQGPISGLLRAIVAVIL